MKRTLCLLLSTLILLSTAIIVVADNNVTAMVNGTPVNTGGTIPAISTIEFTLPNSITAGQLASAVTFEEANKGKAPAGWSRRLYKGTVNSNTLTVTFAEGALSMNSQYRFTFASPAVTGSAQEFVFNTTGDGGYYINENFSRYPENSSIEASGNDAVMLESPWWLGIKRYGRVMPKLVKVGDDMVLRISSGGTDSDMWGAVSYDNAYAASYTGSGTTHKTVTEITFSIAGNPSSVYELGGLVIRTKDNQTGLYIRTDGTLQGAQSAIDTQTTSLNYAVAAPSDQKVFHTMKMIQSINTSDPNYRTYLKLWFDGVEVPMPAGGISANLSNMGEDPVNYTGNTNLSHVFSTTNCWATANTAPNILVRTEMDVYSYKYASLEGSNEIIAEGSPQFAVDGDIVVRFGDTPVDTNASSLSNHITIDKVVGGVASGSPLTYEIEYDDDANEAILTPVVPLENNAEYQVAVSGIEFEQLGVVSSATSKNFITTWEKLDVSSTATTVTATDFTPTATVTNNSGAVVNYTTRLALYKVESGRVSQVDYVDKSDHTAIPAGETQSDVLLGTVSDPNPSENASYFARVFFLENSNIVAKKILIGAEPAYAKSTVSGSSSAIDFTPEPNINIGRIDVQGQYVGGMANSDRGLWITVTNPAGAVIYNDQLTSGSVGQFAFGFNLIAGAAQNGDYSVVVKPTDTAAFGGTTGCGLLNLNFDAVIPEVTALEITGNAAYNETLTAEYSVIDFVGRPNASVVTWMVADTADAEAHEYTTVASGIDLTTYTIPAEYVGKYLKCVVTPKVTLTAGGTSVGLDYEIDTPIYITSKPVATGVSINQETGSNKVALVYTVNDPLNHERGRKVTWLVKNADGSDAKVLVDDSSDIYIVKPEDNGKTIQAEVTPCVLPGTCIGEDSCNDILTGNTVLSNELVLTYTAPSSSTTTSTSGGGGGGIGKVVAGAGNLVEDESVPVYQSPDETLSDGSLDLTDARGHWAEKEIFNLYDKGIVTGRTEREFDPDGQITRAEFAAILVRAMGLEILSYNGSFNDVAAGDWYADILETAKYNGLFEGANGYANPTTPITREEMVQIIVRAYEKVCGEIAVGGGFLEYSDARSVSLWAQRAVVKATEISLINGTGDGRFSPQANTTRAQGAVVISRLMPHLDKAAVAEQVAE